MPRFGGAKLAVGGRLHEGIGVDSGCHCKVSSNLIITLIDLKPFRLEARVNYISNGPRIISNRIIHIIHRIEILRITLIYTLQSHLSLDANSRLIWGFLLLSILCCLILVNVLVHHNVTSCFVFVTGGWLNGVSRVLYYNWISFL